jgi:site-specific recombinase XerD
MILGRGLATTDGTIIAEYHTFLEQSQDVTTAIILQRLKEAPGVMLRRLGKPIAEWSDAEVRLLLATRTKTVRYGYQAFTAFLLFRGYRPGNIDLCTQFPLGLSRYHRHALLPYRRKLEETQQKLGYFKGHIGSELNLLIMLLATVHKPLEELTRPDFEAFRDAYQCQYRATERRQGGQPDTRLTRLEFYLVAWGVLSPRRIQFQFEVNFARLGDGPIRTAVLNFMAWCEVKYQPSTIASRRAGILHFWLWFQDRHPTRTQLDEVTRPIALEYAQHLRALRDQGTYSSIYARDLYRSARLFYEFVILENLPTSPGRNPFGLQDIPWNRDPVPRYLADHELQAVLRYLEQGASLKERTLVITLLHTGIRAAEVAALKATDIVQIQGHWKLHIHEGKGLKDRLVPLTPLCLETLQRWQTEEWEHITEQLFTRYGRVWHSSTVSTYIRELGLKIGLDGLTPHRFRHTFAVALLNYGMRESALQKVMGHATLSMTLEYARILDHTVEQAFNTAVEQMRTGPISWVPSFFKADDYFVFTETDTLNWIRLPHGYCRRNLQLHCESDVKCLLCERFVASTADLPRLAEMQQRFQMLGLPVKANVVATHIQRLGAGSREESLIPADHIFPAISPLNSPVQSHVPV